MPQYNPNLVRFGTEKIHNVGNLVKLPTLVHRKITAFYNSKAPVAEGKYVYEWLSKKPFKEQYEFGMEIIGRALRGQL